ncbi:LacI family DNA-binding transcriptional regulator [Rudaeicoccus suwonensis]|nr:LacI family DNA-binding transcriptional regulator [Rudaeicoccus suwonensis]
MADIARQLGISKAAVSYALNGQPGVAADTRERVLAVAQDLGWHPSASARALTGSELRVIGLALSRPTDAFAVDSFFFRFLAGVESVLVERGWSLLLRVVGDNTDLEVETYRRWWGEGRIDGVIVVDERHHDERIAAIEAMELPAVLCGGPRKDVRMPCLWTDQAGDGALVVEHLADLAHRRIAHISGPRIFAHERARQRGVRAAAARHGMEVITLEGSYAAADADKLTRRLVQQGEPPTALIFGNDHMSVAGLRTLRELEIAVPEQISVVSWDDSPLTTAVDPPLTALARDTQGYGRQAAEALLDLVAGRHRGRIAVPRSALRVRSSTAIAP